MSESSSEELDEFVQEYVTRYAESAAIAAVRYRRYLCRKGLSEDEAIYRAAKQAVSMVMASGLDREKLLETFEELHAVTAAIISWLRKELK